MSMSDEEWTEFFFGEHAFSNVTEQSVEAALVDLPIKLKSDKDWAWLAKAVRRALAMSVPDAEDGPNRTSNTEIREKLQSLRNQTNATWEALFQRGNALDSKLFRFAFQNWDGEGGNETSHETITGEPLHYRRFLDAIKELNWVTSFLRDAEKDTESQSWRWRLSEQKLLRIERGQYLAPVFAAAFDAPVTANNFPSDRHRAATPFMTFYQAMVSISFDEHATPDLSGVVKESCRRHRLQPFVFAKGLIPGLGGEYGSPASQVEP